MLKYAAGFLLGHFISSHEQELLSRLYTLEKELLFPVHVLTF